MLYLVKVAFFFSDFLVYFPHSISGNIRFAVYLCFISTSIPFWYCLIIGFLRVLVLNHRRVYRACLFRLPAITATSTISSTHKRGKTQPSTQSENVP
jgi:hypothetical protein